MSTGFLLLSLVICNVAFKFLLSFFYIFNIITNFLLSLVQNTDAPSNSRRNFLTRVGLTVGSIAFGGLLYGIIHGRYQFRVIKHKLKIPNLPDSFVGMKIAQISDMHLGSFPQNSREVAKGVKMVNNLNPDYILFTGDLINERAIEAEAWIEDVSKLQAKYGKFSSLGNHDYGDYYEEWQGQPNKIQENLTHLEEIQSKMGFRMLRNENVKLEHNGESIRLVGLENWGTHGFSKYGDLNKAMNGVNDDEVIILMSHDPTHWDAEVAGKTKIDVSLAGHTHGSQIGVEVPGFRWSPVQYVYPRWAGMYQHGDQKLYVNRGFGYIGYAGRIGIWPEITLFELEKA